MKKPSPVILAAAAFAAALAVPAAAESIWLEAESLPQKPAAATSSFTKPEWLSGGQVLALNLESSDAVAAAIPADGLVLRYPVTAAAGNFTLWNRVVFSSIRAPFEWRVNGGDWQRNSEAAQPITNVQELAFWNPVGWTRLGTAALTAGSNSLEIRLSRQPKNPADPSQGFAELRYISDVFHLTTDEFQPNFSHRPGNAFQTDKDRAAAAQRFTLPGGTEPRRSVALSGLWQFAPYDEIGEIPDPSRVTGVADYPAVSRLSWHGLSQPGDRNTLLPGARFSHRFVLRTQVDVPAVAQPAGYHLEFRELNFISTLFVNGRKIGDFDIARSRWQVDVSAAIKPGATNEILLVVKDTFYAIAPNDKDGTMRSMQYLPESIFESNQGVTMRMDFPVANGHGAAGILDTATLVATSRPVYVDDTFVKPFPITKKQIDFDVTLRNAGTAPAAATIRQSVRAWPDGKTLTPVGEAALTVPAGQTATATLSTASAPFPLWWIFQPALHELVTEVVVGGQVIDRHLTRFGNREWEIRGNEFFLNGIPQNLRADLTHLSSARNLTLPQILKAWQDRGMNMFRKRFPGAWNGLGTRDTIAWMDEVGMPVRLNAGTFDGQVASYRLQIERNPAAGHTLFDRWHKQMLNGVETFKNHPSVFIWELDNEIVYINARNLGWLGQTEPAFSATSKAILQRDPTRSTVSGGGRALMDESLPTYGVHYFEVEDRHYPDEAYTGTLTSALEGSKRDARVWPFNLEKKPVFHSETAFLPGRNPSGFAAAGGEVAFLGKREAKPAAGLIASWLAEGYRWKGYAATHFWFDTEFTDDSFIAAWQPVAILRREWNATFAPGQTVSRELRVYNDLSDTRPITTTWSLEFAGKSVGTGTATHTVAPGRFTPWNINFTLPATTAERGEGQLVLTAARDGKTVSTRSLPVTLLPDPKPAAVKIDGELVVWDPSGEATARLRAAGYKSLRVVTSMAEIPERFGLLVVGRNALKPADATARRWQSLAAQGNKMVFLEQAHPLHFQAIPADLEPTDYDGSIAFSQNLEHRAFLGLAQNDLRFWSGDHVVYRHAVRKPSRGGVSLAHCDEQLGYSALLEVPVEQGLIMVSQFAVGEKLGTEVVARRLFDNLVAYTAGYKKVTRPLQILVSDPPTLKALAGIGASVANNLADPVAALRAQKGGIIVVQGTLANLKPLAAAPKELAAFWQAGGYLVVRNITPESLAAFNQIVGYEHVLRPFREEFVRLPAVPHPLTAGLTLRDVIMSSGRRIQVFNQDEWPTNDGFDHIVDVDDIAPFATFPPPAYWNDPATKGPGDDTWPLNMVNGFTADTHWRMVFSMHLAKGDPSHWTMQLPRAETVREIRIRPNRAYHKISEYRVTLDGDAATAQTFKVDPADEMQVLNLVGDRPAKAIELAITKWVESGTVDVVGVDNLEIIVARPADFATRVRPMLNIGGLVAYPREQGGVVLDQYVFRANEANPVNAEKKKTLLAVLLRNLGADLGGERTVVPGLNLDYGPITLEHSANLYLTSAQGWSAPGGDLATFPRGANTFAGVRYLVRDFTTSPLESVVTLQHPELKSNARGEAVDGISVNTTADSLFFLHTFLQTREWKPSRQNSAPPALFEYVVNYDDGTAVPVVVTLNESVASWLQAANAAPLPKAEIAWSGPATADGKVPTVYQFQWNNPAPAKKIKSVTLRYAENGKDYGAPVLLGVTAARLQK